MDFKKICYNIGQIADDCWDSFNQATQNPKINAALKVAAVVFAAGLISAITPQIVLIISAITTVGTICYVNRDALKKNIQSMIDLVAKQNKNPI